MGIKEIFGSGSTSHKLPDGSYIDKDKHGRIRGHRASEKDRTAPTAGLDMSVVSSQSAETISSDNPYEGMYKKVIGNKAKNKEEKEAKEMTRAEKDKALNDILSPLYLAATKDGSMSRQSVSSRGEAFMSFLANDWEHRISRKKELDESIDLTKWHLENPVITGEDGSPVGFIAITGQRFADKYFEPWVPRSERGKGLEMAALLLADQAKDHDGIYLPVAVSDDNASLGVELLANGYQPYESDWENNKSAFQPGQMAEHYCGSVEIPENFTLFVSPRIIEKDKIRNNERSIHTIKPAVSRIPTD